MIQDSYATSYPCLGHLTHVFISSGVPEPLFWSKGPLPHEKVHEMFAIPTIIVRMYKVTKKMELIVQLILANCLQPKDPLLFHSSLIWEWGRPKRKRQTCLPVITFILTLNAIQRLIASIATRTRRSNPSTSWKLKSRAVLTEDIPSLCWDPSNLGLAAAKAFLDFLEASIALLTSCA